MLRKLLSKKLQLKPGPRFKSDFYQQLARENTDQSQGRVGFSMRWIWGLAASACACILITLQLTAPPSALTELELAL